ncbi:MAG: redoxin domain-containing protein [Candidatus Baltobacteraceae bacterium]
MKTISMSVALLLCALPGVASAQSIPGPQVGQAAPEIAAKGLNGQRISLADYKGKVLVLNFWATWCPPCRAETPDMINSYRKLHSSKVEFLGIDSTEKAPIIHSFLAAKQYPVPVAIDNDKQTSQAYDVRGIPTTYVIDGNGIVRARFVDIITPGQLASFVGAAKAGHNGVIASSVQTKIDAALKPSQFVYPADHEGVLRTVKGATDAINRANALLGQADPAKGEAADYLKTRSEQAALEATATAALAKVASSDPERAVLYRIEGDLATNTENWSDAVTAYKKAIALNAKDEDSISGLAFAYYEQKNWRDEIATYEQLNALGPDPDTYVSIAKAYLQLKDYPNAIANDRRAVEMAEAGYAKKKGNESTINAAYTWLYLGRAYSEAGDVANAHMAFSNTMRYGQQLPRKGVDYAKYTEEAQEADVALGLNTNGKTSVSLAPWTGADLPGSLSSTVKYRLVVSSRPGTTVQLAATGLSKGWIASFCTDKLCSPMQRTLTIPASGVKIFEFQLIPSDPHASAHTKVQVRASSGDGEAVTGTVVASR